MKNLLCLLALAAATAATAAAQNYPQSHSQLPTGLTVGETAWTVIPLYFFNASGIAGGGGGGGRIASSRDPAVPTHVANAIADARSSFGDGGRGGQGYVVYGKGGWRAASVKLTNTGAKGIKRVHFDFVFTYPQTGAEVLRLAVRSPKRLRAGQTRLFRKEVKASKTNRRGDGARLSVEVKEIVYADGSVWRPRS